MSRKIMVFCDWYSPGYKAGGPIRSCVNFVEHMQEGYELFVFTSDRDLGDASAYEGIKTNEWLNIGQAVRVFYASPEFLNKKNLRRVIERVNPSYLYLNSMFSYNFSILPLLLKWKNKTKAKLVLAPRGMLKDSAIQFKKLKKLLFLKTLRWSGIQRKIIFHATDSTEESDIKRFFGKHVRVALIPNFPPSIPGYVQPIEKRRDILRMIFIGRIHPIKNLHVLLNVLRDQKRHVSLTIVGVEEVVGYGSECKLIIKSLPPSVSVRWLGEVSHDKLINLLAEHHIFALPTQGENFGHAIFESMSAGKPVLISDQTPWRRLEKQKIGWDLPLDKPVLFQKAIDQALDMDQYEYEIWAQSARNYATAYSQNSTLKKAYLNLFN